MFERKRFECKLSYDPNSFCNSTQILECTIQLETEDISDLQEYCLPECFDFDDDSGNKWRIKLEPFFARNLEGWCEKIYINLELLSHKQPQVMAYFNVPQFESDEATMERPPHNFIENSKLKHKYYFDSMQEGLMLFCKIEILDFCTYLINCKSELGDDFGRIFESGMDSNVIIAIDGRELKTHRAILCHRSEVFAAMFEHECIEKNSDRITITDLKYHVVEEMLRFIYSGNSPNIKDMAAELLNAAEKYSLTKLRNMCIISLMANTTVQNAVDMLELADRYNIEHLSRYAMKFRTDGDYEDDTGTESEETNHEDTSEDNMNSERNYSDITEDMKSEDK